MSVEEIRATYDLGPEAVIALVQRLLAIIAQQQQQIAALEAQVEALQARVKELEDRLATDSQNSSKPPSSDGFGGAPSEGTLNAAVERCAAGLATTEEAIKERLRATPVAHFDETGFHIEGKRYWLHSASIEGLTCYGWHTKRGKEATDTLGILPRFEGRAVHDGWSSYFQYGCDHALCNAHHPRELTFVQEQDGQSWAGDMKELLLEVKARVEQAKAAGAEDLNEATRREFEVRYQRILAQGMAATPPLEPRPPGKRGRRKQSKAKNLLDRLAAHQQSVLAFMEDFRVPFDNNLAERDLRMVKVQQKISGCFRSGDGATAFCRIRGYISTVRKQRHDVLAAIEHVFAGSPFVPSRAG